VVHFSYQAVTGLIYIADQYWHEFDGACARQGVDPLALPFNRFLNAVYAWAVERLQYAEDARQEFDDALFDERGTRRGAARGDNVSQKVIDEEWELFNAFAMTAKTEMG
jgi:hypothetical protein